MTIIRLSSINCEHAGDGEGDPRMSQVLKDWRRTRRMAIGLTVGVFVFWTLILTFMATRPATDPELDKPKIERQAKPKPMAGNGEHVSVMVEMDGIAVECRAGRKCI
jgi:hypothetical protein